MQHCKFLGHAFQRAHIKPSRRKRNRIGRITPLQVAYNLCQLQGVARIYIFLILCRTPRPNHTLGPRLALGGGNRFIHLARRRKWPQTRNFRPFQWHTQCHTTFFKIDHKHFYFLTTNNLLFGTHELTDPLGRINNILTVFKI